MVADWWGRKNDKWFASPASRRVGPFHLLPRCRQADRGSTTIPAFPGRYSAARSKRARVSWAWVLSSVSRSTKSENREQNGCASVSEPYWLHTNLTMASAVPFAPRGNRPGTLCRRILLSNSLASYWVLNALAVVNNSSLVLRNPERFDSSDARASACCRLRPLTSPASIRWPSSVTGPGRSEKCRRVPMVSRRARSCSGRTSVKAATCPRN